MNYSFDLSQFDTDLFEFKVAKINHVENKEAILSLINDLKKQEIRYATYRVHANNFQVIHALEKSGFLLVDGLISLKTSNFEDASNSPKVSTVSSEDLEALKLIASSAFSLNRFYNDPVIPKEKADELYAQWIENSLNGKAADLVLVYKEESKLLGFLTLQRNGHIPLAAVSEYARGKGVAKSLINSSFEHFKKWEVKELLIETQMGNIPALRAYTSCGFKIVDSHLTFRWTSL